jgi:hypothetical protein
MPASPQRAMNRSKTKFGFSLHSIIGLGIGAIIAFALPVLFDTPLPISISIGMAVGIALGLTIGTGTQRFFRALYVPPNLFRSCPPNTKTRWTKKKNLLRGLLK